MAKDADTVYTIVRKKQELEEAFSLVYREYEKRGYIPKHYKSKLRLSLYNAIPSTATFIGKQQGKVVATVTLVVDSPLGLPMDKIYKKELDNLRRQGRRVAEVSQLSIDETLFPKNFFSMFNFSKLSFIFKLFKLVLDYSLSVAKLNDLCIAINPKHQYLYKFLEFEPLGGLRYYGSVNRAPAIAKRLNLDLAEKKARRRNGLYKIFFGGKTDPATFKEKFILSPDDIEYFFVKKSNVLETATPEQLNIIKKYYPSLNNLNKVL